MYRGSDLETPPLNLAWDRVSRFMLWMAEECAGAGSDDVEEVAADVLERLAYLLNADEVQLSTVYPDRSGVDAALWVRAGVSPWLPPRDAVDEVVRLARRAVPSGRLHQMSVGSDALVLDEPVRNDAGDITGLLTVSWHTEQASEAWNPADQPILESVATILVRVVQRVWNLRHVEHHDAYDRLTGLPKRERLLAALDHELHRNTGRNAAGFSLAYCTVTGLEDVAVEHGQAVGDAVAIELASRLRRAVRREDVVCRIGASSFAVLSPAVESDHLANWIADRLQDRLTRAVIVDGSTVTVGCHLGVIRTDESGADLPGGGELLVAEAIGLAQQAQAERRRLPCRTVNITGSSRSPAAR